MVSPQGADTSATLPLLLTTAKTDLLPDPVDPIQFWKKQHICWPPCYFDQEIKIMLSVLAAISRSRVSKIPRGPRWQIGPNLPTLLKRPLITRAIESTPFIVRQQLQVNLHYQMMTLPCSQLVKQDHGKCLKAAD